MACFCGGDGELDGFQITQFPHQDHVGVFPQGGLEGIGKAAGVFTELTLVNHAAL